MHSDEKALQAYLDLAALYKQQQDAGMREVFLMLAADAALRAGRPSQAEQLRQELLRENPHHVLKPFPTFVEAAQHPDIDNYLDDLRQKYPLEVAEDLLGSIFPMNLPAPGQDVPATMPPQPRPKSPSMPPPAETKPPAEEGEKPFKVYREQYEVDETQPPPTLPPQPKPAGQPRPRALPRQAPPRPAASPRPSTSTPPPRTRAPVPRRAAAPPPPIVAVPRPGADPEEDKMASGAWVGTLLYVIVLAVAVAVAMFTLVPHELFE